MNIDNIINESVNKFLIKEGFSGKHFLPEIEKKMPLIMRWVKMCDNGEYPQKSEGMFSAQDSFKINLKPFANGRYMQQKFQKNSQIKMAYNYAPDMEIVGNVMGVTNYANQAKMSNITIKVLFNRNASEQNIKETILHELTHAIDFRIGDWQNGFFIGSGIRSYNHQTESVKELPNYITRLLYYLWDTHEFQAWQSSLSIEGGLSPFVEKLMNFLEEANNDNNQETWEKFKTYMTKNNQKRGLGMTWMDRGKRNFSNTSWQDAKNYFIKTSFNKLKKFIKKSKI